MTSRSATVTTCGTSAGSADLFAHDGAFTALAATTIKGRAELQALVSDALTLQPRPFIHNHVIEMAGDGFAYGRC